MGQCVVPHTRDVPLNDKALFYISGTWMYSRWRDIDIAKSFQDGPCGATRFSSPSIIAWEDDSCMGGNEKFTPPGGGSPPGYVNVDPQGCRTMGAIYENPHGLAGDVSKATYSWVAMSMRLINEPCPQKYGSRCNIHLMPHTCLARKTLCWKKILWMFSGNCWKGI